MCSSTSNPVEPTKSDYEAWRAMGQGGIPSTWEGYLLAIKMENEVAHADTTTPTLYAEPEKHQLNWNTASPAEQSAAQTSFLTSALPQRAGPQARAKRYVFPQRERNAHEIADLPVDVKVRHAAIFKNLGEIFPGKTQWKISGLEKQGTALWLADGIDISSLAAPTNGEVVHVHESDLSGHVTLSFEDAKEVISKGWGERHRLSGTHVLPLGYTLMYTPRSVEECEVYGRIMKASVEFMLAGQA